MVPDPNDQTVEMRAILRLEKALRRHIREDAARFDRLESKLEAVKIRLQVLIPLVVASAVAAYFGAHG